MRKDSITAKLIQYEIERNNEISKVRYIVEQYFGLSYLHNNAKRALFTDITKNKNLMVGTARKHLISQEL